MHMGVIASAHLPQDANASRPNSASPARNLGGACLVVLHIPGIEPPHRPGQRRLFRPIDECSYHRFPAHFAPSPALSSANPTSVFRLYPQVPSDSPSMFTTSAIWRVSPSLPPSLASPTHFHTNAPWTPFGTLWMRVLINSPSVKFAVRALRHRRLSNS